MKPHSLPLVVLAAALVIAPAFAAQPQVSTIQLVEPGNHGMQQSNVSVNSHSHVRQRLEYGKGYRYGHSVNGVNGNIIIWSSAPYNGYATAPHGRQISSHPVAPPTRHKPHYGKTTDPDYGQ
jgi:hypothetical protein